MNSQSQTTAVETIEHISLEQRVLDALDTASSVKLLAHKLNVSTFDIRQAIESLILDHKVRFAKSAWNGVTNQLFERR